MSYTNGLDKPSDYFNTLLWTGDGTSSRSLTGTGFQPDWTWIKRRSAAQAHSITDSVRGVTKSLRSDTNAAEDTNNANGYVTSFDSDGFTVAKGSDPSRTNTSGATYVGWNWLAGGTASSNTDGSITSNVSASTTSGFSIVSWTGTGTAGTIGHGLGATPSVIIAKSRDTQTVNSNWVMYHKSLNNNSYYLVLNSSDNVQSSTGVWNNTAPTSSVFSVGTAQVTNTSAKDYIAYCFADTGSKFFKAGSYTGNGSGTGGVFNYTGFKPAMVIIKGSSTTGEWLMYDNKRSPFNETRLTLSADNSDAEEEVGQRKINMVSNGFEIGSNSAYTNSSGQTYIYMAFAENPFVTSTGVPTTAR